MTDALPETMFAVIQTRDGYSGRAEGPVIDDAANYLENADVPVPTPGPGEVLIKVRMAAVNPSDMHFIKGEYGQPNVKGAPAGFEACGDVVAAGKGAEGLVGQRVGFVASVSGAWADYAVTNAMMCVPLHPDLRDEDGAAQIVNPLTAIGMIDIAAQAGDAVVISAAASQLGKLMIALAKARGLKTIAMVRRMETAQTLMDLGATTVLDVTDDGFEDAFKAASKELKPRVFLDAVTDQISETVFANMPNKGRWIIYGKLSPAPVSMSQLGGLVFSLKQIEGFWLTRWMQEQTPEQMMAFAKEVQGYYLAGTWATDVSTYLPLKDVVTGLANATKQKDGKVMITAS
ncbi:MAG: zinc-binding dehydrogenase [Pseudomonadota bacterium]